MREKKKILYSCAFQTERYIDRDIEREQPNDFDCYCTQLTLAEFHVFIFKRRYRTSCITTMSVDRSECRSTRFRFGTCELESGRLHVKAIIASFLIVTSIRHGGSRFPTLPLF